MKCGDGDSGKGNTSSESGEEVQMIINAGQKRKDKYGNDVKGREG